ncbi:hypothetical protein GCM10022419_074370 [Nonomuraea rosea]|uniref:Uncharacterized protein n=1 Tax=Nonomuraea rosea TaxID=638574 RepID=A0ABP6YE62_9ACTN
METDPIRALEAFVLGWFPAEEPEEESTAGELGDLPEALAAFHRLARLRPALHRFHDPVLQQPKRTSGPLGDRLAGRADVVPRAGDDRSGYRSRRPVRDRSDRSHLRRL